MIQYYIQTSAGQEGPYTLEELRDKDIHAYTPVWNELISEWTPAGKIPALKSVLAGAGSPPPFSAAPPVKKIKARYGDVKNRFSLSLFQWLGIGGLIIIAFIYFYNPGDSGSSPNNNAAGIDAAPVDSTEEIEKKRLTAKIAAKNKNYRNNWSSFIKAVPGRYKTKMFGGIYNLEANVQNKTDYPLDVVIISVSYIKSNGGIYKTKYVPVYNVPSNGKATVRAPDSDRGTKVKFRIIQISSRKMHFLYSNDMDVTGKEDPYFIGN